MTPHFARNAADAVIATASDRAAAALSMMGQGDGRAAIIGLMRPIADSAGKLRAEQVAYDAVAVMNVLLVGMSVHPLATPDIEADLCAYVMDRVKHHGAEARP